MGGVTGLGEGHQALAAEEVGDLAGGAGDRTALRARLLAGNQRLQTLGEELLLGRDDDLRHRLHGLDRVRAHARLGRQHDRVRAVQDRVGDVGGLGARRVELVIIDSIIWVATITGLALRRHSSTRRFCTIGTFSSGYSTARSPRATITASNAATTPSMCSTACGFSTLAMTGTRRPSSSITLWTSFTSLASRTKDRATMSQPIFRAKRRSSTSFSDSAGDVHGRAGQVDALVVGDHTALDDDRLDLRTVDLDDLQLDVAVVDEDRVALGDIAGQTLVGRAADVLVTGHVLDGDGELVTTLQLDGTLGEGLQADLRALEVGEHTDGLAGLGRGGPDAVVPPLVLFVRAVAEVEAGHIHAGFDQRDELLVGVDRGAESTDDFRTAHGAILSVCFATEYSVWWKIQMGG